jgi:hypothetical protein
LARVVRAALLEVIAEELEMERLEQTGVILFSET